MFFSVKIYAVWYIHTYVLLESHHICHESQLSKHFVLARRFVANATYYGGTLLGTSLFQNDEHCGK